jgi:hypothetical protein
MFQRVVDKQVGLAEVQTSIKHLSEWLKRYHEQPVIVLIDEYDAPIQSAYLHGYYDKIIDLLQPFLYNTLKGNTALHKGVLPGIMRVSKENLFSGVNNSHFAHELKKGIALFGLSYKVKEFSEKKYMVLS